MSQPIWITENNLGSFLSGSQVYTNIVAEPDPPATQIIYALVSGYTLPSGLTLDSAGFITGTINTSVQNTYLFNIKATDEFGNVSVRTFSMLITLVPNQPSWITSAGSLGIFPSFISTSIQLEAVANLPSTSVIYELITGYLPSGLSLSSSGLISGTPQLVDKETTYQFTVRAKDNNNNIRDRTFSLSVSGTAIPQFSLPSGILINTLDSMWVELQVQYTNPDPNNSVIITVEEGLLPPGLEINQYGLIRGYAEPPTTLQTLSSITTIATQTETTNIITCVSTLGFTIGRTIQFSGTTILGGLEENKLYYIRDIISSTQFTISATQNGSEVILTSGTGLMTVLLNEITVGQPTIRTYNFTLKLSSILGDDSEVYSITVINQNTPISQGGPGYPPNSRRPVILNTMPRTFNITENDPYYGYYLLPNSSGATYPSNVSAPLGVFQSDNYFAFKIIGYDFDGDDLTYRFIDLPTGLTGDTETGWITGSINFSEANILEYYFRVLVYKSNNFDKRSAYVNFSMRITKDVSDVIVWQTESNLGAIYNGSVSIKSVSAYNSTTSLFYRVVDGELPPNLTLLSTGEISGYTAFKASVDMESGETRYWDFTIEAYSPYYNLVRSNKTFSLGIQQKFSDPIDKLYMKCVPSVNDRLYINTLLNDKAIIPSEFLYRPDDANFGKANSIIYEHMYGVYSRNLYQYLAAIDKNHYWRNITLGEIETAIARDENGNIIYEVVYSKIIDNLINPQGISVSKQINWPRSIDLSLGPWYTSVTNIYTSWEEVLGQQYYTSLTPGYANTLYPNSLPNMRAQIKDTIGQELDSAIFPLWMTSQQENGSTLGFTQAWVICYTKPGYSKIIKNNIENNWRDELGRIKKLNQINFTIDKFSVDKSLTYNYDTVILPGYWESLPSGAPVPDPTDSRDLNVIFQNKTILPKKTQY